LICQCGNCKHSITPAVILSVLFSLTVFFFPSPSTADISKHSLDVAVNLGGIAGFGGGENGTTRIAYMEYEYRWVYRFALCLRLGGQSSYNNSGRTEYDWDAVGLEGEVRMYPFRGRMRGFHAGGSVGAWVVEWDKKKYIGYTMNGEWFSDGSGTSLGWHFSGRLGYKFMFASRYYVDTYFQPGVMVIEGEDTSGYVSIGAAAGLMW